MWKLRLHLLLSGLILIFYSQVNAQEIITFTVNKRVFNRLYTQVFSSASRKIFDDAQKGKLVCFKDDKCMQTMEPSDFIKTGRYREKVPIEKWVDGKAVAADSFYYVSAVADWIWGFRKTSTGNFTLLYQSKNQSGSGKSEIWCHLKETDVKLILTTTEFKLINQISALGNHTSFDYFLSYEWKKFEHFKAKFWDEVKDNKIKPYSTSSFTEVIPFNKLGELFRTEKVVTIVQDSNQRELDYQKVEYLPFDPENILGLGFSVRFGLDSKTGLYTLQPVGFSPQYDASGGLTGEVFMTDPMYWLRYVEMSAKLTADELNFISDLIFMATTERLVTECMY